LSPLRRQIRSFTSVRNPHKPDPERLLPQVVCARQSHPFEAVSERPRL